MKSYEIAVVIFYRRVIRIMRHKTRNMITTQVSSSNSKTSLTFKMVGVLFDHKS